MNILISKIRIDGGTQNRVQIDPQTVKEYSDAITEGSNFPPITVFFDGASYWLADGFHRYWAHNDIGSLNIDCDVINGSCRDAFIYSLGANHKHGLPRSNEDKKKSVLAALNDAELSKLSQSKIAEICKVSREYVSRISQTISLSCDRSQDNKRKVERNGKTYEQDTSNIGKAQHKKESDVKPETPKPEAPINDESDEPEFDEASIMAEIAEDVDPEQILANAQKEIDRLEKIIATNDQLAEIKKLKDEIRLLKSRLDGLQVSLHERSNSVKYWKTKYEKLEKQVKAAGLEDF